MRLLIILLLLPFASADLMRVAEIPMMTAADQYYSILFDEEGEAIVSLRINMRNMEDSDIDLINIQIPGNINLIGVMQETAGYQEQVCVDWRTGCEQYGQGETCIQYDYNGNCANMERPCLKYGRVCNRYQTNYYNQPAYERIKVEPMQMADSVNLPIQLANPIKENGKSTLLIVYKANGIVDKSAGLFKYDFETVMIPYTTSSVRVAVNVQQDLYLKGGESKINYLPSYNTMSLAMEAKDMSADMARGVNQYSQQIAYAQGVVKTAQYLDPLESFSVEGKYSKSWLRLNIGKVLLGLILLGGVICFLWYGAGKLKNYAAERMPKTKKQTHLFMVPFLAGLFTSLSIALLWILSIFLAFLFDDILRGGMDQLFAIIIILLAVLLTLALIIGVPVYTGNRFGAITGLFTVLSVLGWLFILAIVTFLVLAMFSRSVIMY